MNEIADIKEWFKRAIPNEPTLQNKSVQLGCHVEEFAEMLEALTPGSQLTGELVQAANELKRGPRNDEEVAYATEVLSKMNRVDFLDALCDQIVTAIGLAHMFGMDIEKALLRVNSSNWSKFNELGQPIFDENGKIKKGPSYAKAGLSDLV